MKQAVTYKNIWRVSLPIIISSAAQNFVNAADTAFLGKLGQQVIGAAGNSILFYYVFVVAALGFSIGGEIMVGRRNGEGDYEGVGNTVDHCAYFFLPLSFFLFILLHFYSPSILSVLVSSQPILDLSNEFLQIRSFGIFFALANLVFRVFYIGITETRILIYSTVFMALLNVVLDYLLIFGHLGFEARGIAGAAIASVISEAATTLYFAIYTYRKVDIEKYQLFAFKKVNPSIFKKLFTLATPTMIQNILAVSAWLLFFLIIEKMGETELAVSHIVRSIYMIMIIPLFGFSAATSTLVSNIIGQGDIDKIGQFLKKAVTLSFLSSLLFFPIILLFPMQIIGLYSVEEVVLNSAKPVLLLVNLAMLLFSISYILFSAVAGTGKTTISLTIEVLTISIYLGCAYTIAMVMNGNLWQVWSSEFIYFGVMGSLSFIYLKFGKWRHNQI